MISDQNLHINVNIHKLDEPRVITSPPPGIRVNTSNPTVTPGTRGLRHHTEKLGFDFMEYSAKWSDTFHPLYHRCSTIQEQVDAILFLCSDQASFVTGQHLYVDGGYTQCKGTPPPARESQDAGEA